MTRSIFAAVAVSLAGVAFAPAFLEGCKATGVGDPCTPEQEYKPEFLGFDEKEVNVESKSFQCQTRLCLVNHFRGRVSCPYGQEADKTAPGPGAADKEPGGPCKVPGSDNPIVGRESDPKKGAKVEAQCTDRTADKAVYCSCRCADLNGKTDEGNFCKCPDGFSCTQLVTSIGAGDTGLTGAYCIKNGTDFDRNNSCGSKCDPATQKCD
jgi:hypothetical protein